MRGLILCYNKSYVMKKTFIFPSAIALALFASCSSGTETQTEAKSTETESQTMAGQSGVKDNESAANIVQVASGSADHSTLVAAVKAGGLVDVLSNAGPFTVFAPTNAAFDKLPAGTVDNLLKEENKE